jgi:hypothetical protein
MHGSAHCDAWIVHEDALQYVGSLDDVIEELEVLGVGDTICVD